MASVVYPKAKEALLQGSINLSSATVKAILVDTADYTYNAAHDFFDDITTAGRVGASGATTRASGVTLGSKTFTNGVFDAADAVLTAVTGDPCEAIVIYIDDGSADATSRLIAYIDTATGLPVTPNGADITITWNASGIFAL